MFDPIFDHIKTWTRYGTPNNTVRPILRLQRYNEVESQWKFLLWKYHNWFRGELNLFGDWYVVSLTSKPDTVLKDLRDWVKVTEFRCNVWPIGEQIQLEKEKVQPKQKQN
jgi:hypothetical protein